MFKHLYILLLICLTGALHAQGWERVFPGGAQDEIYAVAVTPDGGYILAGHYNAASSLFLIKVDVDGNRLWDKKFPGMNKAAGASVVVAPDGGYVILGFKEVSNGNRNIYLLKTDAFGNKLWEKTYGGPKNEQGFDLLQMPNGDLAFSGFITDAGNMERLFIARADASGNLLWSDTLAQTTIVQEKGSLTLASNGDLVAVASSTIMAQQDIFVVRVKGNNGAVAWQNNYNFNGFTDLGRSIIAAADGGFVIAGSTASVAGGGGLLMKIDAAGDSIPLWYTTFPNTSLYDVTVAANGDYLASGYKNVSPVQGDLYIVRTDSEGSKKCDAAVGKGGPDIGYAVATTPDGGAVSAGTSQPVINTLETNAYLAKVDANCLVFTDYLQGEVYHDYNKNCFRDSGEPPLRDWVVKLESPDFVRYATSDADGKFQILVDTGNYVMTLVSPNPYWSICGNSSTVSVTQFYDTIAAAAPVQAEFACPRNEVHVATPILHHCANNIYTVRYCNSGTVPSVDTKIDVTIDSWLSVTGSSMPWSSVQGNTYTFNVGYLANGDCGSFTIDAFLDCDNTLTGQSHCVKAHIYPDSFCNVGSGNACAIIEARARCNGDSVVLSVKNVGKTKQVESLDFIVIEDVLMLTKPNDPDFDYSFNDLDTNEIRDLWKQPANGKTLRLITEQQSCYPGLSYPTAAVEGCISDTSGTGTDISLGYFTMFPEDDGDAFVSSDCQESYEADYNPVFLKRGHPKGYDDTHHYVSPKTDLDFLIRFQNNGADTIKGVIVCDTLSAWLDPTTVQPGAASHPYDFEVYGNGIVRFTLPNLNLLPDSSANEGYVKFRVSQKPGVPCGTEIFNSAAVYFDYQAPFITNETFHTVCDSFIVLQTIHIPYPGASLNVFPNPFDESAMFEIKGVQGNPDYRLELYDAQGRLLFSQFFNQSNFRLFRRQLPAGTLFYRLSASGRTVATGKLIAR